jgi:hypothetical protein
MSWELSRAEQKMKCDACGKLGAKYHHEAAFLIWVCTAPEPHTHFDH